ncbi:MAG: TIGR00725 family protein [Deltaproteobacteria bacterium]|nr:TIGR00725 family protein [Deltaproteobacteria bacterium]
MKRKPHIAVIGDSNPSPEVLHWAEEVGRLVAQNEGVLICGGLGGVMAAAARGAADAGGLTIGILPSYDATTANAAIGVTIPTGLGHARNALVVSSGDVVIALPGSYGTLSEVALALTLGKSVIGVNAWADVRGVEASDSPAAAVALAFAAAHRIQQ